MLCMQGGERDVVKLLDFGLVKELQVEREVQLTGASAITGTPQYMAPESIRAPESVDARTDLYALGAVAYFLLAGKEVFDGQSVVEVCSQHLHQKPEPLSAHGVEVPPELEALVLACLEKDPARRPESAAALRAQLEACRVEPWTDEDARRWWQKHQAELAHPIATSVSGPRTIAVQRQRRSAS
jgi:serine/threonine-protein kinase